MGLELRDELAQPVISGLLDPRATVPFAVDALDLIDGVAAAGGIIAGELERRSLTRMALPEVPFVPDTFSPSLAPSSTRREHSFDSFQPGYNTHTVTQRIVIASQIK